MVRKRDNIVVGLDIGTTKVCALVAEVTEDNRIKIAGIGTSPSKGLRKGVVVNIEDTVESVRNAVRKAEQMAGVEIKGAYTGIAGGHINGLNSRGMVAIKNQDVTLADIDRAIEAARAVAIPPDREILHVIPQEFIVDGQDGIKNPLGISGVRLEVQVHIITGAITSVQNIVKSINKAGLEVLDIILQPLASSEAVLTPDEKDLGVVLVDIGGGTTDMAIFVNGAVSHTAVIPIGGNHLTNDIAVGLRTPTAEAERIKTLYGCALPSLVKETAQIEVSSVGGRPPHYISRQRITEIIEPRVEEIFDYVAKEIKKVNHADMLSSGIVLTGGSCTMEGIVDMAERVTGMPVRRGFPTNIEGLSDTLSH
ncbi:MAG TPA: cell division protein FtsA, partial [Nitrospirota bacterium]|nr:cell division protein FtsA [Nitrospirota bacterium]